MRYLGLIAVLFITYSSVLFKKIDNPDSFIILPVLRKLTSLNDYLLALWNYQTIDFQPIRDLTIYLDLFIQDQTGFNTFVFQNMLWWTGILFVLERILRSVFKDLSHHKIFIILSLFALYPLFSPVLVWGMARKHILALFFSLIFVDRTLRPGKNILLTTLFYTFAVLSQPITLLLPFWSMIYQYSRKPLREIFFTSLPSLFVMGLLVRFNYYYYETSQIFQYYYPRKTSDAFNFTDKLLALGHYFFQIFYPYNNSFHYSLGNPTVFVGIGIFILFIYLGFKLIDRHTLITWFAFIMLPLSIVLTMPHMMSDTYLLLPSVGTLILLVYYFKDLKLSPYLIKIAPVIFLCWGVFDFFDSQNWYTSLTLARSSFRRQPSCLSSFSYLRIGYEEGMKADPEAKKFIETHECPIGSGGTTHNSTTQLIFNSNVLYYEEDAPLEKRIESLDRMSHGHFYPHLLKAALLIQEKRFSEANQTISEFEARWPHIKPVKQYVPAIAKVIYPYCLENKFVICTNFTKNFSE